MTRSRWILAVTALVLVALGGVVMGQAFLDGRRGVDLATLAEATPVGSSPAAGAHANGAIPDDQLVEIAPGLRLLEPAAAAYDELRDAARAAGHDMTVNSAYRDLDEQRALVERYGLLEDGGRAAPPGESEHGEGTCVDVTLDFDALAWMREHAPEHGFTETIADEPWHWNWSPR